LWNPHGIQSAKGWLLFSRQHFTMNKIGRNDPCPSGSGEKFKKCLAA
jgi:uncharacterized protein YecA (UPF0149 family)